MPQNGGNMDSPTTNEKQSSTRGRKNRTSAKNTVLNTPNPIQLAEGRTHAR